MKKYYTYKLRCKKNSKDIKIKYYIEKIECKTPWYERHIEDNYYNEYCKKCKIESCFVKKFKQGRIE